MGCCSSKQKQQQNKEGTEVVRVVKGSENSGYLKEESPKQIRDEEAKIEPRLAAAAADSKPVVAAQPLKREEVQQEPAKQDDQREGISLAEFNEKVNAGQIASHSTKMRLSSVPKSEPAATTSSTSQRTPREREEQRQKLRQGMERMSRILTRMNTVEEEDEDQLAEDEREEEIKDHDHDTD